MCYSNLLSNILVALAHAVALMTSACALAKTTKLALPKAVKVKTNLLTCLANKERYETSRCLPERQAISVEHVQHEGIIGPSLRTLASSEPTATSRVCLQSTTANSP